MKKVIRKNIIVVSAILMFTFCLTNKISFAYSPDYKTVRVLEEDTTGDGVKEKIKIIGDEKNHGYIIDVVHGSGKTYRLKADKKLRFLGHYTTFYSLKTIIADINSDKVPEIAAVGSGTHEVPLHIFRWNGSDYKLVFSDWTYTRIKFKDITGDNVPELIVFKRLYGTGEEDIYYQWKEGRYRRIYYEMDAARGFDRLTDVLEMVQNGAFPYSEDIPEREKFLKNYFTGQWVQNKDNIKHLQQFNKGLLSIQISNFQGIDQKYDPQCPGHVIEEKWKFNVKVFRINDSKVIPENWIMEVDIKPVEGVGKDPWRIDNIKFSRI